MAEVSQRRVLVVGSTGTVGSEVLRACLERGLEVRALVRDARRARGLPAGAAAAVGDLRNDDDVRRALHDVDAAFYVSPHIPEEEECARRFTEGCRERGARLVFVGSHLDGGSRFARAALRLVAGRLMPQFKPKWRLSEAVRRSEGDVVMLMPTNYFQNDELRVVVEGLRSDGAYRYPVGHKGMNRVDARDIGEVAARALVDPSLAAGAYPIAGPRSITGQQCAALWGHALGREVRYDDDAETWERGLREELQGQKLDDILATYAPLARFGVPTVAKQVATTTALLGRPPTPYEDFVQRTAALWRAAA